MESRLERAELLAGEALILAVAGFGSADNEHVTDVRLQLADQVEGAAEVHGSNQAGGIREAGGAGGAREKNDRCVGKQIRLIVAEEIQRQVLHRDDDVESLARVLRSQ